MNRSHSRRTLVAASSLSLSLTLAGGHSAMADDTISDFGWAGYDTGALGTTSITPTEIVVTGGDAGSAGDTGVHDGLGTPFTGKFTVVVSYTSTDTGQWDRAYYWHNGSKIYFADNDHQGSYFLEVDAGIGYRLSIGVETADGNFGPGVLTIQSVLSNPQVPAFKGICDWEKVDEASGIAGFSYAGPFAYAHSGNVGIAGKTYLKTRMQIPFVGHAGGQFTSDDGGPYDNGYIYNSTAANPFDVFIDNATQGPWQRDFNFAGGTPAAPGEFGFGVTTLDGQFGAGSLWTTSLMRTHSPAHVYGFEWDVFTTGGGSVAFPGDRTLTLTTGDQGVPSYALASITARQDMVIVALFGTDTNPSDTHEFFNVWYNGERPFVAQSNFYIGPPESGFLWEPSLVFGAIPVKCGDTLTFAALSTDGLNGPSTLTTHIYAVHATDEAPVWEVFSSTCGYADCDHNWELGIDDFICFQTNFALGDVMLADCDLDGVLGIDDFICFQTFYALGC